MQSFRIASAPEHTGYNFITDAESATATEIAVFGVKPGGNAPADSAYYVPPTGSDVVQLVKAIANID